MKLPLKNIVLLVLMLVSAALGAALRPHISLADERPPINLAAMVPTAFGDWQEETNLQAQVINPQQKSMIDKLYTDTLSRTYISRQGYRIMLSIAYGKRQSDELRAHQPEGCYEGQGFHLVLPSESSAISTIAGQIPVTRLVAANAARNEPITYWIRIGDQIARTQWEMKKIQLGYALTGKIPDGMLVRVSSISTDNPAAFDLQRNFIDSLLSAVDFSRRRDLIGKLAG